MITWFRKDFRFPFLFLSAMVLHSLYRLMQKATKQAFQSEHGRKSLLQQGWWCCEHMCPTWPSILFLLIYFFAMPFVIPYKMAASRTLWYMQQNTVHTSFQKTSRASSRPQFAVIWLVTWLISFLKSIKLFEDGNTDLEVQPWWVWD